MNNNFLITGGAGFIGSHLCERLLTLGHRVICIDNLSLGTQDHIQHLISNPQFSFINGDVIDTDLMEQLCRDHAINGIYHLAANSDIQAGGKTMAIDLEKTLQTTIACIECIRKFKINTFVFASSSAVYGRFDEPMTEESGPCRPVSFYGAAKLASENYIHAMLEHADFQAWIIRFPNVVGHRLTHGVIYDFIRKLQQNPKTLEILGDGNQCKPYMLVEDLIDGILVAQNQLTDMFNVINIGVDSATTVTDIANKLVAHMKLKEVAYTYTGGPGGWAGDVPQFSYDLTKMKAMGWAPKYSSDQAVQRCIEYEVPS